MLQTIQKLRIPLAAFCSAIAMVWLSERYPFPQVTENPLLAWAYYQSPAAFWTLRAGWAMVLFGIPFLYLFYPALANLRRISPKTKGPVLGTLPPYPYPITRTEPSVILGETHYPDRLGPSPRPGYLQIGADGLCLGLLVMGAPGTGKSAGVVLQAADQLFGFRAFDPERRIGGLVLEVKGDLCKRVKKILKTHARSNDYLEVGMKSKYCYNPLHNNASPTALAFSLVSLMKTLHGKSKEPFWEQAAECLLTFLILVYRLINNYVTLFDIYRASSDIRVVDELMKQASASLKATHVVIDKKVYLGVSAEVQERLSRHVWDSVGEYVRTEAEDELRAYLIDHGVAYSVETGDEAADYEYRQEQLQSAARYYTKLRELDKKLRTNVAEGINVFLMVTDVDPTVRRIFCPPKEAYNPVLNADHRYGLPLPPLETLIETPTVLALNMPIATDEAVSRIIGTLLKQDWQRAVLARLAVSENASEEVHCRELALVIDEYHLLATVSGENAGMGDEKFLNLCRAAKCIPVVAFQSLSSLKNTVPGDTWSTILAAFATTVVLRQKDFFTADHVSKMCGRADAFRENYGFTEGGHDAKVSLVTGRTTAPRTSVNMSHNYNLTREYVREAKEIMELPRGVAVVLANTRRRTVATHVLLPDASRARSDRVVLVELPAAVAVRAETARGWRLMTSGLSGTGWELLLPFLRPVAAYLEDDEVSEIMINPDGSIYVERAGAVMLSSAAFPPAELEACVDRIARRLGQNVSPAVPLFEGRLPDGSRVAAIYPPCSVGGITFTIRKFQHRRFDVGELIRREMLTRAHVDVLAQAIRRRENLLISGGTGTGKTTLLNALTEFIPDEDRVILLEDVSEIYAHKPNLVRLEARREQREMPAVTIADLLRATLRHRPDRIIVGEVRGAEAYELLQALNTGHSGSLSTLQADSAEQATARLTTCVMQRTTGLSHAYIRSWIADSIHVLVHLERCQGERRVTQILRLEGYDHTQDRYRYRKLGQVQGGGSSEAGNRNGSVSPNGVSAAGPNGGGLD